MKRYTTRVLKSVAIFYLVFPLGYILAAATLFDIPAATCVAILLSPFYYLVSFLAVVVGYGLWEMRRWSWYAFISVNALIIYENAVFVRELGETQHKFLAFAFSVLIICVLIYRVAREVRVPYFFPKIRWWESNPRYRLASPAHVIRAGGDKHDGEILDVSVAGCFVKSRDDWDDDEPLQLEFTLFGHAIRCRGRVVWRPMSTVTHPRGIGIKFENLPREEKRMLRVISRRLRRIATLYRRSRYLISQEEFLKRMQLLEHPVPRPTKKH